MACGAATAEPDGGRRRRSASTSGRWTATGDPLCSRGERSCWQYATLYRACSAGRRNSWSPTWRRQGCGRSRRPVAVRRHPTRRPEARRTVIDCAERGARASMSCRSSRARRLATVVGWRQETYQGSYGHQLATTCTGLVTIRDSRAARVTNVMDEGCRGGTGRRRPWWHVDGRRLDGRPDSRAAQTVRAPAPPPNGSNFELYVEDTTRDVMGVVARLGGHMIGPAELKLVTQTWAARVGRLRWRGEGRVPHRHRRGRFVD